MKLKIATTNKNGDISTGYGFFASEEVAEELIGTKIVIHITLENGDIKTKLERLAEVFGVLTEF